jgi:hypothetical protein
MASPAKQLQQVPSPLEWALKWGGASLALVYGIGYLIVALHNGAYGIAEFAILKPKAFAAGILFVFFIALGAVSVTTQFKFFAFPFPIPLAPDAAHQFWHNRLLLFRNHWTYSFSLAILSLFLLATPELPTWRIESLLLCIWFLAHILISRGIYKVRPPKWKALTITLLDTTSAAIAAAFLIGAAMMLLAVWYYGVGLGTILLRDRWHASDKRAITEWDKWALYSIMVLLAYSTLLHPKIRPQFGGGSPIPVTVYLQTSGQETQVEKLFLIEHTPEGYYFKKQTGGAYFLQSSRVPQLYYGHDTAEPLAK